MRLMGAWSMMSWKSVGKGQMTHYNRNHNLLPDSRACEMRYDEEQVVSYIVSRAVVRFGSLRCSQWACNRETP